MKIDSTNSDNLLDMAQFQATRWSIIFQNVSSGVVVPEGAMVSILEITEKELVFDLPAKSCVKSHNVHVIIQQVAPVTDSPIYFEFTGKVKQAEKSEDGRLRVTVGLVQFQEAGWTNFQAGFADNQEQVTQFLRAAKGH